MKVTKQFLHTVLSINLLYNGAVFTCVGSCLLLKVAEEKYPQLIMDTYMYSYLNEIECSLPPHPSPHPLRFQLFFLVPLSVP